ncbi:MAG: hypothetical protein QOI80_3751, partial [Solirubrobacteraceae bacterium]|nr:hypothetical protein [Solirubrobacteraceae bacterium]
ADQAEVWAMVGAGPMQEAYADHAHDIESLIGGMPRRDGQTGALVAIGGSFVVLDLVSRADAWAALHAPLVRGYALDAVRRGRPGPTPTADAARDWLERMSAAPVASAPAPGLGERIRTPAGTGLAADGELIQLSLYATA